MAAKVIYGGGALKSKLLAMVAAAQTAKAVRVGFLEGSTYPDGTSVPMVAAVNEFGKPSTGQPPRPYFRRMVAASSPQWGTQLGKLLKANAFNAQKTLAKMGKVVKGQLQTSIRDLTSPPLAMSTILARARGKKRGQIKSPTIAKPLIDTGTMLDSVDYEVTE